jgi:uncharacterized Fe-S cluster protein YjdI
MPKETFKYSNNDITVVWKPNTCMHSTLCWTGLLEVFNPRERPWIKIEGSTTGKIIEQVKKCPSGALSYFMNDLSPIEPAVDKPNAETTPVTRVQVTPNGPYILNTECVIVHSDGREETRTGKLALCRCGSSGNKPYCDGTHKKAAFKG